MNQPPANRRAPADLTSHMRRRRPLAPLPEAVFVEPQWLTEQELSAYTPQPATTSAEPTQETA